MVFPPQTFRTALHITNPLASGPPKVQPQWSMKNHMSFWIQINRYQSNQFFTNKSYRFCEIPSCGKKTICVGWLLSCSVSDLSIPDTVPDTNISELKSFNFTSTKIPPVETRHRYKKTFPPRRQSWNRPCLNRLNPIILPVLLVRYLLVMLWCVQIAGKW